MLPGVWGLASPFQLRRGLGASAGGDSVFCLWLSANTAWRLFCEPRDLHSLTQVMPASFLGGWPQQHKAKKQRPPGDEAVVA